MSNTLPSKQTVMEAVIRANDYWISENPVIDSTVWSYAVYFMGNMAAYRLTGKQAYLDYAVKWGRDKKWIPDVYQNRKNHADDQACLDVFLDLHGISSDLADISPVKAMVDGMVNSQGVDFWYWIDAVFMAGPLLAKLSVFTGDSKYSERLFEIYRDMRDRRRLWDAEESLWYRDESYMFPKATAHNGGKLFWGRGNGWVFGGLARILEFLPDDRHAQDYIDDFCAMASRLKALQCADGFWRQSLLDYNQNPEPEESATALNIFAFACGINLGILNREEYLPVVLKGWEGLATLSLRESGLIGWVQSVAAAPGMGSHNEDSTADYGVGAFLLAACEIYKLIM